MFDRRLFLFLFGLLVVLNFWTCYELLPKFEDKNKQQKTLLSLKSLDSLEYTFAGKRVNVSVQQGSFWLDTGDEVFLASDAFKMVRDFAMNLRSQRQIPRDFSQDEEFGFGPNESKLVLNGQHVFRLGKKSYGTSLRYLIDSRDDKVLHLIEGESLESLENARRRFFERKLLSMDISQIQQLVIQMDDKMKILRVAEDSIDSKVTGWLDQDDQSVGSSLENLLDRFFRTNVEAYLLEHLEQNQQPIFKMEIKARDGQTLSLIFYKTTASDSVVEFDSPLGRRYWARLDRQRMATIFADFKEQL